MSKKELEWLSKHEKKVEKYSGRWIAVLANKGIIASGRSPRDVLEKSQIKFPRQRPLVMKIPRKDEEMYVL